MFVYLFSPGTRLGCRSEPSKGIWQLSQPWLLCPAAIGFAASLELNMLAGNVLVCVGTLRMDPVLPIHISALLPSQRVIVSAVCIMYLDQYARTFCLPRSHMASPFRGLAESSEAWTKPSWLPTLPEPPTIIVQKDKDWAKELSRTAWYEKDCWGLRREQGTYTCKSMYDPTRRWNKPYLINYIATHEQPSAMYSWASSS